MATHYEEDEEAQYTYHTTEEEQVPDFPDGNPEEFPEGNFYGMDGSSGLEPMPVFQVQVLVEGKAPVLLSVDTLRKMGAIIDFASDEVIFSQVAPDKLIKLERSTSGHQLLPLTSDFFQGGEHLKRPVHSLKQLVADRVSEKPHDSSE
ncbi:unnamed protein product [Durusdinium trenchii]|uniref:Transcription factor TFIIIC triple barrel domain-containing protein n=1 Tax=Durusdinium trenchii TaxID=1381693 RepID=A0ABP0LUA8_9DINO